jgi:hypothetical protein
VIDHYQHSACLSLSPSSLRYVFEIFDPDQNFWLEQPDVEAIYRMLYDTDDHDTKHIQLIKFDDNGRISKEKFIKHMRSKKFIIRPALDYQKRVRKMLGGLIMWEGLSGYRKRHFSVYDTKSTTLEDSFRAIIASPVTLSPLNLSSVFDCMITFRILKKLLSHWMRRSNSKRKERNYQRLSVKRNKSVSHPLSSL